MTMLMVSLAVSLAQDPGTKPATPVNPATGTWHAWLDSRGGELPFCFELAGDGAAYAVVLVNQDERLSATTTTVDGDHFCATWLDFDSTLQGTISGGGTCIDGEWRKQREAGKVARLTFHARFGIEQSPPPPMPLLAGKPPSLVQKAKTLGGRYRLRFAGDEHDAVAILDDSGGGRLRGTILTETGDFRYLSGWRTSDQLTLGCFDGAHAFLLRAYLRGEEGLQGNFWSADGDPQAWTASKDAAAALRDPYAMTTAKAQSLRGAAFRDLAGSTQRLDDPELLGRGAVVLVFGSWCPNCHDATKALLDLAQRYADRGFRVVGLACEVSDDVERNRRVLTAYAQRHAVPWPILLAGPADKKQASKALGFLDAVRAYPTALFVRRDGTVEAVYTGFVGPAGGREHRDLLADWDARVVSLLR